MSNSVGFIYRRPVHFTHLREHHSAFICRRRIVVAVSDTPLPICLYLFNIKRMTSSEFTYEVIPAIYHLQNWFWIRRSENHLTPLRLDTPSIIGTRLSLLFQRALAVLLGPTPQSRTCWPQPPPFLLWRQSHIGPYVYLVPHRRHWLYHISPKQLHEIIKILVFFLEAQHQFQVALNHRHGGVLGFILIMGDVPDQF